MAFSHLMSCIFGRARGHRPYTYLSPLNGLSPCTPFMPFVPFVPLNGLSPCTPFMPFVPFVPFVAKLPSPVSPLPSHLSPLPSHLLPKGVGPGGLTTDYCLKHFPSRIAPSNRAQVESETIGLGATVSESV